MSFALLCVYFAQRALTTAYKTSSINSPKTVSVMWISKLGSKIFLLYGVFCLPYYVIPLLQIFFVIYIYIYCSVIQRIYKRLSDWQIAQCSIEKIVFLRVVNNFFVENIIYVGNVASRLVLPNRFIASTFSINIHQSNCKIKLAIKLQYAAECFRFFKDVFD